MSDFGNPALQSLPLGNVTFPCPQNLQAQECYVFVIKVLFDICFSVLEETDQHKFTYEELLSVVEMEDQIECPTHPNNKIPISSLVRAFSSIVTCM